MSTVKAAESIFGPKYDVRTYSEVGRIVADLGIKRAEIFTDNSKKLWTVIRALGAENVTQILTNTIDQMIADRDDPKTIIQMFLKHIEDGKYEQGAGKNNQLKAANNIISYLGYSDALEMNLEHKIDFLRQYLEH